MLSKSNYRLGFYPYWALAFLRSTFLTSPQMSKFTKKKIGQKLWIYYQGSCSGAYCNYHNVCLKCTNNHPSTYCRVNNYQPLCQEKGNTPAFDHIREFPYRSKAVGSQRPTHDLWDMAPTLVELNVLNSMLSNYSDQKYSLWITKRLWIRFQNQT